MSKVIEAMEEQMIPEYDEDGNLVAVHMIVPGSEGYQSPRLNAISAYVTTSNEVYFYKGDDATSPPEGAFVCDLINDEMGYHYVRRTSWDYQERELAENFVIVPTQAGLGFEIVEVDRAAREKLWYRLARTQNLRAEIPVFAAATMLPLALAIFLYGFASAEYSLWAIWLFVCLMTVGSLMARRGVMEEISRLIGHIFIGTAVGTLIVVMVNEVFHREWFGFRPMHAAIVAAASVLMIVAGGYSILLISEYLLKKKLRTRGVEKKQERTILESTASFIFAAAMATITSVVVLSLGTPFGPWAVGLGAFAAVLTSMFVLSSLRKGLPGLNVIFSLWIAGMAVFITQLAQLHPQFWFIVTLLIIILMALALLLSTISRWRTTPPQYR